MTHDEKRILRNMLISRIDEVNSNRISDSGSLTALALAAQTLILLDGTVDGQETETATPPTAAFVSK